MNLKILTAFFIPTKSYISAYNYCIHSVTYLRHRLTIINYE